MSLNFLNFVELPKHNGPGGFDHAAIHAKSRKLYVAHTANDSLDVIDLKQGRYSHSISNLKGVAGALVSDERDLVFTSNRGEDSIGIFSVSQEDGIQKVQVGSRPNGLAFDAEKNLLLVANVGLQDQPGSYTLSLVNVAKEKVVRTIVTPGRTRWAIFNPKTNSFYVNVAKPAQILIVPSDETSNELYTMDVLGEGPHGLDLDFETGRLFCACDGAQLVTLDVGTKKVLSETKLSGAPDVIFFNPKLKHLYVAIGDPGVIDIFDTQAMKKIGTTVTEYGAHTIAFDAETNQVYAFLPKSHRAAVFEDRVSL
jgi:DNA-binding beta-propeller fold protein YncE